MRTLVIIFTLLILIVSGALLAPQFMDWNQYKGQIIAQIESNTGFKAEIDGDLDLAVLPMPRVIVNDFKLTHPAEQEPLITLDHVDVYLDVVPLLSGTFSLKSITLNKPQIALRAHEDGTQNWMTETLSAPENDDAETADASSAPAIEIGQLSITEGRLSYEDKKVGSKQEISDLNGTFAMTSLQGPFEVATSMTVAGWPLEVHATTEALNPQTKSISANIKAGAQGAEMTFSGIVGYGDTPDIQGETALSIVNMQSFLNQLGGQAGGNSDALDMPLQTKGILSANASELSYKNMTAHVGDIKMTGGIDASGLDRYPVSTAVSFNLQGDNNALLKADAAFKDKSVMLKNMSLRYGTSDLVGTVTWKFPKQTGGRAEMDVIANATNVNVDELMSAMGQTLPSSSSSKGAGGIKSAAANIALPFDVNADVKVGKLTYDKQSYNDVQFNGGLDGGALRLTHAQAKNYAGLDISAKGNVKNVGALGGVHMNIKVDSQDMRAALSQLGQADAAAALPESVKSVAVKGTLQGDIDRLDFDVTAEALSGKVSAKGMAAQILTKPALSGITFGLQHPNLASLLQTLSPGSAQNKALAQPVNIQSQIDLNDNVYVLNDLKGSFGPVNVNGAITADMSAAKPDITGQLKMTRLALDKFIDTGSSSGAGGGASGGGRWSKDPIDTAWMEAANIDLQMAATQIIYGGWQFDNPSFGLVMKNSHLKVSDWKAGLFGGNSKLNLNLRGGESVSIESDLGLEKVGLQSLVSALAGAPIVQSKGEADLNLTLSSKGGSMNALIHALSGKGAVNGTDITVRGIDVADLSRAMSSTDSLGGQAKALLKTGIRGGSSKFETLEGAFDVDGGIVTFSKLYLAGEDADVATLGNVSLPAWTLDMRSSVQLKVEEGVEVPPPFEISYRGSLSNPGSSFAQNALEGYLNKKLSAKAGKLLQDKVGGDLGNVLGGLLGVQQPQKQPSPADNNEPAVGDEIQTEELPAEGASPYVSDSVQLEQQQTQQAPAPAEEQKQEGVEPEDVIKDVLKGFLR